MTTECERFEIEIGMRQHGALDAREEVALDAHLRGCPTCQRFAATFGGIETTLRQRVEAVDVTGLPWTEVDFAEDLHRAQSEVYPAIASLEGT